MNLLKFIENFSECTQKINAMPVVNWIVEMKMKFINAIKY